MTRAWKKWCAAIVMSVIGIAIGARTWHLYNMVWRQPRLAVSDLDLGIVIPGMVTERALTVRNLGRAPLVLSDVSTCCGTSTPYGWPKEIPPGSEAYVLLRLNVLLSVLPYSTTVRLKTNDPAKGIALVHIRGKPDSAVVVKPLAVDLGYVIAGRRIVDAISIETQATPQERIHVATSTPFLKASVRDGSDDGKSHIDVEIAQNAPRGKMQEYLYVKTHVAAKPTVVIPVSGIVERGLTVRPPRIFFGVVTGDSVVTRSVRLRRIGQDWSNITIDTEGRSCIEANIHRIGENDFKMNVLREFTS